MKKELNEIGNVFTTDILIIGGGLGGTITAAKVHELKKDIMDIQEILRKQAMEL